MRILEVTERNLDKYYKCFNKAYSDYEKSGLNLVEKERKAWIFDKIDKLFRK